MERIKRRFKDRDIDDAFKHVSENALGNPILFDHEPTADELKANTIGKVKGATDYIFIKTADGKAVKIPVSEVT